MEVPSIGRFGPHSRPEPLLTLRSRAFPSRVHAVLESLLNQLAPVLEQAMLEALDALEQQLFRHAEQARSNDEQQRCFESLREVRRVRADVTPALIARFESALASFKDAPRGAKTDSVSHGHPTELAWVETSELEDSLARIEAVNRAEVRSSQALFELGMRFAALAEAPAFEPRDLPIGPHRLGEAVHRSIECFDLPLEHRQLLTRCIERALFANLDQFYDQANRILVENRILPHLIVFGSRGRRGGSVRDDAMDQDAANDAMPPQPAGRSRSAFEGADPRSLGVQDRRAQRPMDAGLKRTNAPNLPMPTIEEGASRVPARPQRTRFGLVTPAATTVAEAETGDIGRFAAFARPMVGWPGVPIADGGLEPGANDDRDPHLFQTMRALLSGRRQALGLGAAPAPDQRTAMARREDLLSVLGVLQQKPATPMVVGGKLVQRTIPHLKQDILNQLRQVTPEGHTPRLQEEDADTIDLLALLFDQLSVLGKPNAVISQLMTKLQVPLLRLVLRDKTFFSQRTHPARQLLITIVESGLYWLDEDQDDRSLIEKMQSAVARILAEFHGDPEVFAEAFGELSRHLQMQAKKSDIAERRHVDAARGRERLELARQTAIRAISAKLAREQPRALIRTLLEQAWTDVLALTVLRHGEQSPVYRERLDFVDALIRYGRGDPVESAPERRAALREALESGLSQIGFHVEDIQSVGDRLFEPRGSESDVAANDDSATLTEVAARLRERSRFGEEGDHQARSSTHEPLIDPPLDVEERAVLARLKSLPFGTWFELTRPDQPGPVRRKLSWFSTVSGRCLFVNQRGARSHESSLEQLARDLYQGRARVYEAPSEDLIDRAWNAILRKMKSIAGGLPTEATEAR